MPRANGTLRFVTANWEPIAFYRVSPKNETEYAGILMDLLPGLLRRANITTPYEIYHTGSQGGGVLLPNGSWPYGSMLEQITSGHADMTLYPLTLTAGREPFMDYTVPFIDDGYGLLVPVTQETTNPATSFLRPFTGKYPVDLCAECTMWGLLLAALIMVSIILTVLDAVTRRARLRAVERMKGIEHAKVKRKRDRAMDHFLEAIMFSVGSGSAPVTRSWSVKILFVSWAIFSVIMLANYTANLTSFLTVKKFTTAVDSLSDLTAVPQPFAVPIDTSIQSYFETSGDSVARALEYKMTLYDGGPEIAIQDLRAGKISAYCADAPVLRYVAMQPPCDLAMAEEVFGPGSLVLAFPKNSSISHRINLALISMMEDGTLTAIKRRWYTGTCISPGQTTLDAGQLDIYDLWGVYLVLVSGLGVAVIWAICEVVFWRNMHHRAKQLASRLSSAKSLKALKSFASFRSGKSASSKWGGSNAGDPGPALESSQTLPTQIIQSKDV